jgi:hypothetical protein
MKKLYFALFMISFIMIGVNVDGQIGVRAGLNIASYSVSGDGATINSDPQIGFHFGIVNDFKLTDNITFRPGLLYSGKGGKISFDLFGVSESVSSTYNYLEIPLSFVYNFKGEEQGFFAEAGPYLGFLLSAKSEDEDIKESFNSLDFGLNLGLGYDLGSFIIGANYSLGLANIAKTEDGDDDVTAKNKNITIYGVYQF